MPQIVLTIVITAIGSSLLTLVFSYVFYVVYLRSVLDRKLDDKLELARAKVKEGMKEAGMELLPYFRAEVREGFKEAMGGQIIENVTRPMSSIVETSLSFLIGKMDEDPRR